MLGSSSTPTPIGCPRNPVPARIDGDNQAPFPGRSLRSTASCEVAATAARCAFRAADLVLRAMSEPLVSRKCPGDGGSGPMDTPRIARDLIPRNLRDLRDSYRRRQTSEDPRIALRRQRSQVRNLVGRATSRIFARRCPQSPRNTVARRSRLRCGVRHEAAPRTVRVR